LMPSRSACGVGWRYAPTSSSPKTMVGIAKFPEYCRTRWARPPGRRRWAEQMFVSKRYLKKPPPGARRSPDRARSPP
jgi:hypothetical protein